MKFCETHFEEYIQSTQKINLHPKLEKIFQAFPENIHDFRNVIFYGPSGVGKYSQMLKSIKKYSPSELKYEKKISVTYNKQNYVYKISDIHYEIDMSLLGCNSRLLWHEIYLQLIDVISAKTDKSGIILCKYFHDIHGELLENFYSYMQQNNSSAIDLKFIIMTEELSFIPDNILNCCEIIHVPRPTRAVYNKCLKGKMNQTIDLENITNVKLLYNETNDYTTPHKIICDKIIEPIINVTDLKFLKFRDLLYDIFIYNLNISHCIFYILGTLINKHNIKKRDISKVLIKTYTFFQYYNNNYRPIYHLENYLLYLTGIIHNFTNEPSPIK